MGFVGKSLSARSRAPRRDREDSTTSDVGFDGATPSEIERIEVVDVVVPRRRENRLSTSYAVLPDAHHVLVFVHADGLMGVGEAPTERWWTGEDAASVRIAIERYLAPAVTAGPCGVRQARRRMDAAIAGNHYAKSAIEMALWDLLGKRADLPVYALLGCASPQPVPVKYVIGVLDDRCARDEARRGKGLGFTSFKLKVGTSIDDDLARIVAVLGELDRGDVLGVDANGGWTPLEAHAVLPRLQELGVSFLEQPVRAEFSHVMAQITARRAVPVVAHESIFTLRDARTAAEQGWADVWALTPSTHGGLLSAIEIAAHARSAGVSCLIGSTVELGVATAAMAHLACALDEVVDCPVPSDIIGPLYHDHDIVESGVTFDGGRASVPTGAGLGVEVDEARLRRLGSP